MKKHRTLWIILIVVLVLAAAAAGVWYYFHSNAQQTDAAHEQVYAQYQAMLTAVDETVLTVTENGSAIGAYDLQTLGLREALVNAVTAQFSAVDRMSPQEYAALPMQDKLDWEKTHVAPATSCAVNMMLFDGSAVLEDLQQMERTDPQDAYLALEDGVYTLHPEVAGDTLDPAAVQAGLEAAAATLAVTADGAQCAQFAVDASCYVQPAIRADTLTDTPEGLFAEAMDALVIEVTFNRENPFLPQGSQTLTGSELAAFVSLGSGDEIVIDETKLAETVSRWASSYNQYDAPFVFDSWVKGLTQIEFLTCNYLIDAQQLLQQLCQAIRTMQSTSLDAQALCYDQTGKRFSLGQSYIEVDFDNQQMTFIKDGRFVVNTNIVTGALNGHQTPRGLYATHGKEHDVYLKGEDYFVFVKYWVSVVENIIGLHDASWRSNFGASFYVYGGSHGCVNTPEAAMELIWHLADDGTPVLMHGVNQWYEPADGNPRETIDPARGTTSGKTVESGTLVLRTDGERIDIQPDDVVPFTIPDSVEDDGETHDASDPMIVS